MNGFEMAQIFYKKGNFPTLQWITANAGIFDRLCNGPYNMSTIVVTEYPNQDLPILENIDESGILTIYKHDPPDPC